MPMMQSRIVATAQPVLGRLRNRGQELANALEAALDAQAREQLSGLIEPPNLRAVLATCMPSNPPEMFRAVRSDAGSDKEPSTITVQVAGNQHVLVVHHVLGDLFRGLAPIKFFASHMTRGDHYLR
jgi:hypothetical protein